MEQQKLNVAFICIAAVKQQKSNDEFRGLFSLEPYYTLWPVGIDKSWPIHTSSQCCNAVEYWLVAYVSMGLKYLFWKVK
jgi:hypothetical protein